VDAAALSPDALNTINLHLLALERCWLIERGLPDRPWFRNVFAASDPDSGYAAWMLPGLRWAVEQKDDTAAQTALTHIDLALVKLESHLQAIQQALPAAAASP
jgi:N-acetylated-alpha-linked acidic dipeptidase